MQKPLDYLTENNWTLCFINNGKNNDIYLDDLLNNQLDKIATRVKLENNKLTVYYALPQSLPIGDMELSPTTLMKLLTSDCMKEILIHVLNAKHELQFIIKNILPDKKPTYEMIFGSISGGILQLIVHYDVFQQEIM